MCTLKHAGYRFVSTSAHYVAFFSTRIYKTWLLLKVILKGVFLSCYLRSPAWSLMAARNGEVAVMSYNAVDTSTPCSQRCLHIETVVVAVI